MGVTGGYQISEETTARTTRVYDLTQEFTRAAALPAPERSLALSQTRAMAQELFKDNSTVFFGETHDDVNLKFLADNPAFFQEAAAQGARYIFLETPVTEAPLYRAFFDGKLSAADFEDRLSALQGRYSSGDSAETYARQNVRLCQMAKDNGLIVLPSDFRVLETGISLSVTSDAFGIPDMAGRDDETRQQTLLSLRAFQEQHGADYPASGPEIKAFLDLHRERLKFLPAETAARLETEKTAREADWESENSSDSLQIKNNDRMQFNYYSRFVEPGEKSIFFGGSLHFTRDETIDDHIENNGYGSVAGVQLLSGSGLLYEEAQALNENEENVLKAQFDAEPVLKPENRFIYTIHTETGQILDQNQKPLSPANEPAPEPAPDDREQPGFRLGSPPSFQPNLSR